MVVASIELRGEPIPGSKYLRDFCCQCGTAMRVVDLKYRNCCKDCEPHYRPFINSPHASTPASENSYNGARFYAGEW